MTYRDILQFIARQQAASPQDYPWQQTQMPPQGAAMLGSGLTPQPGPAGMMPVAPSIPGMMNGGEIPGPGKPQQPQQPPENPLMPQGMAPESPVGSFFDTIRPTRRGPAQKGMSNVYTQ